MRMTLQIEVTEIVERGGSVFQIDVPVPQVAPQDLGYLDVGKMGDVQSYFRIGNARTDRLTGRRVQEQFNQG